MQTHHLKFNFDSILFKNYNILQFFITQLINISLNAMPYFVGLKEKIEDRLRKKTNGKYTNVFFNYFKLFSII